MEFGDWLTHYLEGKGDTLLSSMWDTESPWHREVAHLLRDDLGKSL